MVTVLSWDIGGANTKAAFLKTKNGKIVEFKTAIEYFPFWKRNINQFCDLLTNLKGDVSGSTKVDRVSVTMTAELSDAYRTKREGVHHILNCVTKIFADSPIAVLAVDGRLLSIKAAKLAPLKVASANWVATAWLISQYLSDCVVVDVGSTSTSITPIINGKVAAEGKTDLEKLSNGELVYTGSLRTNVAAIVSSVPLRGKKVRVSSELFAQSGDVHLILGNITEAEYTCETADGKGKTLHEALARLARIVCADTEMLAEKEIVQLAQYIYSRQLSQIAEGITQVYSKLNANAKTITPIVVTGLGKEFLAKKAAKKAKIKKIIDINEFTPASVAVLSPAVGLAWMTAVKVEGERRLIWTP
ncbi:MAG: H4MPT-linked C1 transfer pathway protein [Candidatus Bathyarchaeota archaeon]|nr:H4MPT-linked C1 transfer pathway protein [Candidatus Bathyarchaeota archaeon]